MAQCEDFAATCRSVYLLEGSSGNGDKGELSTESDSEVGNSLLLLTIKVNGRRASGDIQYLQT